MIVHDRTVRFEDIDTAGIVFFARFSNYCHDAMERFFDELPGGYAALIVGRKVGFPAVHVTTEFVSPLRYGDVARIRGTVSKLGTTACHFDFTLTRAADAKLVATAKHVHVCSDLATLTKLAFPADVRAALERHIAAPVL